MRVLVEAWTSCKGGVDARRISAAERGLKYLMGCARSVKGHYEWRDSNRNKSIGAWWCKGAPGISLAFLKAYEIFESPVYLKVAEKALAFHPRYLFHKNFSQCHGLSGLGEIYLEAFRVTKDIEWWERAGWIGSFLVSNRKQTATGEVYWLVDQAEFPTADFMLGNSGVIYFLSRLCSAKVSGFPFLS